MDPIQGYVVNFDVTTPYQTKRFICLAHSHFGNNNRVSQRTIQGPCKHDHDSLEKGTLVDAYMFDIFPADGTIRPNCSPLLVTIFKVAKTMLEMLYKP